MLPRSISALALLGLACVLSAAGGCTTPRELLPPTTEAPRGPVFVLTRQGQVRFGENHWELRDPTQAARLSVLLTGLSQGTESVTLVFRGEQGTTFAEVKLLMDFLDLAGIEDYRVDLGKMGSR